MAEEDSGGDLTGFSSWSSSSCRRRLVDLEMECQAHQLRMQTALDRLGALEGKVDVGGGEKEDGQGSEEEGAQGESVDQDRGIGASNASSCGMSD